MTPVSTEIEPAIPSIRPTRLGAVQIWSLLATVLTVFLVGLQTRPLLPSSTTHPKIPKVGQGPLADTDLQIIYHALQQKPTFLSTFAWWHEKWAGPFNYWRPLTSQFFWLEYYAFGSERFDRWMGAMAVSHLCFTLLLAIFVARFAGSRWAGLLTAYLFAGARVVGPVSVWIFGAIPVAGTTYHWKNEPEVWAGICAVGAMLFARSQRWGWAIAAASASICFKESGWLTWPLVFLALVPDGRYKTIPKWVYGVGAAVSIALFALRSGLGTDIYAGNHATHNVNWLARYGNQVGGSYLIDLSSVYAPLALWSLALLCLLCLRRVSIIVRTVLIATVFFACAAWFGIAGGSDIAAGIGGFLDWNICLQRWLSELGYLICVLYLIKDRDLRTPAILLIALILLSALPFVASVLVGSHTLYLTYGLQSGLVALALIATARAGITWGRGLIERSGNFQKPKENIA